MIAKTTITESTKSKITAQARTLAVILFVLGVTNAVVLVTEMSGLRLLAGLLLAFVLPGVVWLRALNWLGTQEGLERVVLAGGVGTAVSATALLGAVYWPGPLTIPVALIALDLAVFARFAGPFFRAPLR